ncbi:MAG: hypothetical protein U5K69_21780 [Balneolaceae bacterium]|nr:hypothetical protein [Balneolaceae bacterium]
MTTADEVTFLSKSEVIKLVSRYTAKALLGLLGIAIFIGVQIFRFSATNRYYILFLGTILSFAALATYSISLAKNAGKTTEGSLFQSLIVFGGFIPYIYGSYLVFYEGFWRLRYLADGFSFTVIFYSFIFVVIGYSVVSAIYQISELDRAVSENKVKIKETDV